MVEPFLRARGFTEVRDVRDRNGQTVHAHHPEGLTVTARVKLCWRRGAGGRNQERHTTQSATQLMARIRGTDWVGSIRRKMEREAQRGTTHLLLIQRDGESISLAALVPIDDVAEIWSRQRDESERLIRAGALGGRTKNHAMNGHSPTLWLEDQRGGQSVADILWNHAGVVDLSQDANSRVRDAIPEEIRDPSLYIEGAVRTVAVNAYERDRRARRACIAHHGTRCVVCGFSFGETYGELAQAHIHVHHIVPLAEAGGSYVVDPIEDLRPVCANCHSVIHLGGVCRSIDEVREMLAPTRCRST